MDLCVLIFCEPHKEKEGLGFEYGALLGRVFKCLSKLAGSAFYLRAVPVVASALLYMGVSSYQELTQKGFPDPSSTAVASTLRLPAIGMDGGLCDFVWEKIWIAKENRNETEEEKVSEKNFVSE